MTEDISDHNPYPLFGHRPLSRGKHTGGVNGVGGMEDTKFMTPAPRHMSPLPVNSKYVMKGTGEDKNKPSGNTTSPR